MAKASKAASKAASKSIETKVTPAANTVDVSSITEEASVPDQTKVKAEAPKGAYVVVTSFRYAEDFNKSYVPGEDVSHLDARRLEELKSQGLVKQK